MRALVLSAVVLAGVSPDAGTERPIGLARAWGQVKYVHPAMATATIDWDAALLRALPAVENAASEEAYRAAIAGLLAELHDPATRVGGEEPEPVSPAGNGPSTPRLEALDARTAVVVIPGEWAVASAPDAQVLVCERFTEAARFERVVVDLRGPSPGRGGWPLQSAIAKCAGRRLAQDVTLPPARYLTHGFYPGRLMITDTEQSSSNVSAPAGTTPHEPTAIRAATIAAAFQSNLMSSSRGV